MRSHKKNVNKKSIAGIYVFAIYMAGIFTSAHAQQLNIANISADIQSDFQYNDAVSGDSAVGLNVYFNTSYRYNGFEAGLRYEAFQKPMLGFSGDMQDQGIPYRYVGFQRDRFKVTAGSYYAQFGNGLVLRSYEARGLGFDNSLDGIKIEYNIADKIALTALSGKQRIYFYPRDRYTATVRGGDVNVAVSHFFASDPKLNVHIGGSYVSRYNPQWRESVSTPNGVSRDSLPIFVNAYSGRMDVSFKDFSIAGEYATKTKDPIELNLFKDTIGRAVYLTTSYTRTGFGINLQYKEIRDFEFRTDPANADNEHAINYLPAFSRQAAFKLFSKYPYQTHKLGERGYQAEINYSPKRGANFLLNHTRLLSLKNEKKYNEIYIEGEKKFGSKHTLTLAYSYTEADVTLLLLKTKEDFVFAHLFALEDVFKINRKHSIRPQVQFLYTKQDTGNWLFGQIEYTIAPHWSVAVFDEYNIGKNREFSKLMGSYKEHFFTVFIAYIDGNSKFSVSYGKQSAGLSCVGGVCRQVPEFSGLTFSVISKL